MNTLKLIPLLAALPLMANASVTLTSADNHLLINDTPAQLVKTMYDANGNTLTNIEILESDDSEAKVSLTLDGKVGAFEIRATGYSQADTGSGTDIYSASCEKLGKGSVSFYPINYIADGYINIGEQSHYTVSELGGPVSGYNIMGLNLERDENGNIVAGQDCSQGKPATGYALQYSASLTSAVNDYFNQLAFPLSIK